MIVASITALSVTCVGADAAVAVVTWLAKVVMVASVVMEVAREALAAAMAPPATAVETLPVAVPRLETPAEATRQTLMDTMSQ